MSDTRAVLVNSLPGKWGYTQDLGDGRLLMQSHDGARVCVTDARLEPTWECTIPAARGCCAVSPDLSKIAVCLTQEIRLLDSAGQTLASFPHMPWDQWSSGACAFDRDGHHLWAAVPISTDADLVVLELNTLLEAGRASLKSQPAGLQPVQHPDGRIIGWSIGEGQDRVLIRWSSCVDGGGQLRLPPDEGRVLVAIHPAGGEYLTTPHTEGPIERHRIDDDRVIDRLDPRQDGSWDFTFTAGYIDADHILAAIQSDDEEGLLLLDRDPMRVVNKVISEGSANPWSSLTWVGGGTWVTVGDDVAELWRLE
jgi:hypothetical protein